MVNFQYLITLLKNKGIELVSIQDFESFQKLPIYNKLKKEEKEFGSLNSYFVFKKTIDYDIGSTINTEITKP